MLPGRSGLGRPPPARGCGSAAEPVLPVPRSGLRGSPRPAFVRGGAGTVRCQRRGIDLPSIPSARLLKGHNTRLD